MASARSNQSAGAAPGGGVDHGHARHRDRARRLAAGEPPRCGALGDDDDLAHVVARVAAHDVAPGRRAEPARELPLHEAEAAVVRYGPLRDGLALSAALDGATDTFGFSILPRRSIRRDHCSGFSTALSCLDSFEFEPYCGRKPTWM